MNLRRQQGILLILPALVVMGVFTFYPLLEGVRIAFTNKHLLKEGVEFVGLQNFARLASDEIFWTSLYTFHRSHRRRGLPAICVRLNPGVGHEPGTTGDVLV